MRSFLDRLRKLPRWQFFTGAFVLTASTLLLTFSLLLAGGPRELGTAQRTSPSSVPSGTPGKTLTVSPTGTSVKKTPTSTLTPSPTVIPPIDKLINTASNIHLGLAFDSGISDLTSLQGKVDIVWGAGAAKSIPKAFTISYNPSERIGNGASGPLYALSWFQQNHPDWIVYRCDRTTVAYGFNEPNVPLDITNASVLQFLMAQEWMPEIQAGYDGIGFDNVGFRNFWERCGHFDQHHNWVQLYSGLVEDQQYQQSLLTWGKTIYAMLKQASPATKVAMNFSFDYRHQDFWVQMLPYLDILTDEGGFSNFGSNSFPFRTDDSWKTYVDFLQQYQSADSTRGVFLFNETPGATITAAQMQWALANYLLVKAQHTYITVVGQQQYGQFYDHPEFHIAIGTPQASMTTDGCSYQRAYSGGYVVVNPSSQASCKFKLPKAYKTLSGNVVTSLSLGPHSGMVLLSS